MNQQYLELVSRFLEICGDRLSGDSCNDFDLEAFIPDLEQRRLFAQKYHEWNGDPEDYDPDCDYKIFDNSSIAHYLSDVVLKDNPH